MFGSSENGRIGWEQKLKKFTNVSLRACISMSKYIVNFPSFCLSIPSNFYTNQAYHNFDAMLPVEQEARIRPSTFKFGFSSFTIIHPRNPPIMKVNPMLTGINHLHWWVYKDMISTKNNHHNNTLLCPKNCHPFYLTSFASIQKVINNWFRCD